MTGVTDDVDGVTDGVTDSVTDGVTDRFAEETLTILLVVLLSLSNAYFVPPLFFRRKGGHRHGNRRCGVDTAVPSRLLRILRATGS